MNGLLDFLDTPQGRMGLGLFAAAGPRNDGMNTGGRIQLAMQGFNPHPSLLTGEPLAR